MAELQRSVTSFRRQGSSGLVWDDKLLSGLRDQNHNRNTYPNPNPSPSPSQSQQAKANRDQDENGRVGSSGMLERSRSEGARPYRRVNVAPPSKDPPSPKVATCGFCGFLGKSVTASHKSNPKSKKRS